LEASGPYSLIALNTSPELNSYDWFLDNKFLINKKSNQILASKPGFYSVRAVRVLEYSPGKIKECKSNSSGLLSISNDSDKEKGMVLFANPSLNGKFKITSSTELNNVSFSVHNSIGEIVFQSKLEKFELPYEIDLSKIRPTGKYLLKVKYGPYFRTFPVIFE
jgi:hypothetical protein